MSRLDIIRAWKDQAYRQSLSEAERAALPANPAGAVELTEEEACAVEGKAGNCCTKTHHCAIASQFSWAVNPAPYQLQTSTLRLY
jgi:mersacidin/lichenicidin family type 2 lantibiotic